MFFSFLTISTSFLSYSDAPSITTQALAEKHKKIADLEQEMEDVVKEIQDLFPELRRLKDAIDLNSRYNDVPTYYDCECARKLFMQEFWTYRAIFEHLKGEKDRLQSELAKFHASWYKDLADFSERPGKEIDALVDSGKYDDTSKLKKIERLEKEIDSTIQQIQIIFPVFAEMREFVRYAKSYDWVPPYHDCECPKEILKENYQKAKKKMEKLKGKKDTILSELAKYSSKWSSFSII